MTITTDSRPLEDIKADIGKAREFIRKRFNAYVDEETTPSHLLAKPTFLIEFPDVDKAWVWPVTYGMPMIGASAEYRLCWKNGKMYWRGGFALRRDVVAMIEVRD